MKRAPRIGLTTYARDADGWFRLPGQYVDSVRRAGGRPLLLAPGEAEVGTLLDDIDGLVLTGGGDLDPATWGGAPHEAIYDTDGERDAFELDLARRAVESHMPTLAICRGMQVLNVAYGGTLIAHLPDRVGERVLHRVPPRDPVRHAVTVIPGTRLANAMQATEIEPSSWHHQAVDAVPERFAITATAPDGTVEAMESADHPWLVAVQWHPEHTAATDADQHNLFAAFVDACRGDRDATE